jgi:hypothetical protein
MPAHAGIQYFRDAGVEHQRRGVLDHPLSRMMTVKINSSLPG